MCEFFGDKDMWELCRENRRAKSLETFSLCVADALGCFPRAAPPRLGVCSVCKACAAVLLGTCCGTAASKGFFVRKLGMGKTCRFPVMCFMSCE